MQTISAALKTQEAQCKAAEKALTARLQSHTADKPQTPQLPRQFLPQAAPPAPAPEAVSVSAIDDARQSDWDDYVSGHPQASIYHHYGWRQVIDSSFNHRGFYLAATDSTGRIVGILPLIWLQSRLFGSFSVSIPFFNYGGPLADCADTAALLLAKAGEIAAAQGWSHIEIRTTTPGYDLPYQDKKVSMIRALPASDDELDHALGAKVRAQTKLATRHNPEIRFGGVELLEDFYDVFARNMRDLGTPVYAKSLFQNILDRFSTETTVVCVYIDKQCVAAAFLIGRGELLEIPWASTLRRVNKLNINMWMYRQILRLAIDKGFAFFDFGRSTRDAGTYKFKKQWGTTPVQHYWYYWLPAGSALPEINPDNPKYRLVIAIWKKLPLWITKLVGPAIVKNLP
ncbi:FemAB family PEP-CTERM system-associated protein [Exilibacterium tricleocarpae]|uniref:FemAB family PEP-CTERM system-associated protein n=2 Tax=Exilibacterium tricleocarpae TaxID=2591008 RepID=A0A545T3R4_9GAMM|nr:FemAB family PEP-CTERM system-associated protein [Exilibacterium tricleocarpae]